MSDIKLHNDPARKILSPRYCNTSSLQGLIANHERRIIDLETRIAALEAALDKLTGESK